MGSMGLRKDKVKSKVGCRAGSRMLSFSHKKEK